MRARSFRRLRSRLHRRRRDDSGQATIELIGYMPYIVLMFLVFVEAFAFFMTMEEVDNAARTGARVAAQGGDGAQAAQDALPSRLHQNSTQITVTRANGDAHAVVTAQVPMIRGFDLIDWKVTRDATIPIG